MMANITIKEMMNMSTDQKQVLHELLPISLLTKNDIGNHDMVTVFRGQAHTAEPTGNNRKELLTETIKWISTQDRLDEATTKSSKVRCKQYRCKRTDNKIGA